MLFKLYLIIILLSTFSFAKSSNPTPKTSTAQQTQFQEPEKRCPKEKSQWTDKNISKWLHLPVKTIQKLKETRSLDNQALCTLPSATLARAFSKMENPPRPDQPDLAMKFRMEQLSVYGVVKPDGLINAIKQRKQIISFTQQFKKKQQQRNTLTSRAIITKDTISLSRDNWVSIGPGSIGGRIRTLFIHPKDHNLLFAGSVGGGIWKSSDGGASWSAIDDFMANLAVTCIVADPRTTNNIDTTVLYASTGEGFYNFDAIRGYGIFKSTDGGTTWQHLDSTDPTSDSDWYGVNRIAINHNGIIIAVARDKAIFTSTDDADTWSKFNTDHAMEDVKFDPNDDTKAVAGSLQGECYYSADSGSSWTKSTIVDSSALWIRGRVELAYATSASLLYASVDTNDSQGEIYKSTDNGISWSFISNPKHLHNQGWYDNTIWVDPTDENHLVIGGLDLHRSTDGGNNWTKISTWWRSPSSPHADNHAIVSDPGYNGDTDKTVYIANDGGIYRAEDITVTNDEKENNGWENMNHGLGVTQFYGGAGISGSKITGGAQDNYTLLTLDENQSRWKKIYGGDGGFSAVSHHADAGKYYYFGEYTHLKIHRSDNGGTSTYIYEHGLDDAGVSANFIAPFTMDPNDNNTMLAGGASLWRSTNVSTPDENDTTWSSIKPAIENTKISQIAIAEGNSSLILVGYNDGSIYKTTNGTAVSPDWTKIHDTVGKHVLSLLIDKDDYTLFYAGWGGFAAGNLKKSTDEGTTWSDISGELPEAPMRTIVRHPVRSDYLYVGTEVGIFTSEDQGVHWFASNKGPANVSVETLFWRNSEVLVAATHGRGMFRAKIELDPCEEVKRSLSAYHWTLVSFPCQTGNNGIEALLGSALGTYGDEEDWVMYEQTGADDYIGTNTQKRMLDANDTVEPGKGYWIITADDREMIIDHTLAGLSFTSESNASDVGISDDDFTTLYRRELPRSDSDDNKTIMLGNPFAQSIQLDNVYFSHDSNDSGYHPMNESDDSAENPNAPYIKGTVYTFDKESTSHNDYVAITPETPGFGDRIKPMTGFFILLKAGDTGTNYLTFPYEK